MLELDHVAFGVADAASIRADLEALGFAPTSLGVCRWSHRGSAREARATSVVFARGYLDLIEIGDAAAAGALRASPLSGKGIAPTGVVLSAGALAETHAALASRGVAVGRPYPIERALPGADPAQIRYEIFPLREPGLPFAVIADGAPGAMRREAWLSHPNSATGVRSIHLLASREDWLVRAERVFGVAAAAIDLGSAALVVHREPRGPYLEAVAELLPRDDRTRLLAIELSVVDPSAVRVLLARGGIPSAELDGGIGVEPTAGYGCGVVFAAAGRAALPLP